jgi:cholesterol transport system auxiliary component
MKSQFGRLRLTLLALGVSTAALTLIGCVTIFPKEKPVRLYRFEDTAQPAKTPAPPRFTVRAKLGGFDPAAAGDRLLGATGDDTAYIGQARWVSPAVSLFEAAVTHAFETHGGAASLLGPGEFAAADKRLFIDVQTFEVRFDKARGVAPHVVIVVSAALESARNVSMPQERVFQADVAADADAMSAIVPAFDRAVTAVLGEIIEWMNQAPGA